MTTPWPVKTTKQLGICKMFVCKQDQVMIHWEGIIASQLQAQKQQHWLPLQLMMPDVHLLRKTYVIWFHDQACVEC